jgi:hypothetical protein
MTMDWLSRIRRATRDSFVAASSVHQFRGFYLRKEIFPDLPCLVKKGVEAGTRLCLSFAGLLGWLIISLPEPEFQGLDFCMYACISIALSSS